jgi:HAD superfamily hydrolase (TIGR01509 family)
MAIKGLIFDFDGLILETEEPIFQSWQETYLAYDCQLSYDDWAGTIGTAEAAFNPAKELERQLGRQLDWEAVGAQRLPREQELIARQPPLPGVVQTLHAARRLRLKVGLASSSDCAWGTGHLRRLDLIDYFDCIIASDDVRMTKPDPELFIRALAGLDLQPEQVIVFEDSPNGVWAARHAGIFCVAVPTEMTRQLPLGHADLCLNSLTDLPLEELIKQVEKIRAG